MTSTHVGIDNFRRTGDGPEPREGPPDAERGPAKGPVQSTPTKRLATQVTRTLYLAGRHAFAACTARSHSSTPCRRCCHCWDPSTCDHPEHADYEVVVETIPLGVGEDILEELAVANG